MRFFKRITIVLIAIYVGMLLLTVVPTILNHGDIGTIFSVFVSVTGWSFLLGLFIGIAVIVICSIFPSNKEEKNNTTSEKKVNKSINESDEVI